MTAIARTGRADMSRRPVTVVCRLTLGFERLQRMCAAIDGLVLVEARDDREAVGAMATADALIVFAGLYTEPLAAAVAASPVRWIHFATAGTDPLWQYPVPAGVTVSSGGKAWSAPVAEHAVALLLALARRLPEAERLRHAGNWRRDLWIEGARVVRGMRVMILGYGAIGREIEARLRPFGADIVRVARNGRQAPRGPVHGVSRLAELAAECDAMIVTAPLTPASRHLVGDAVLDRPFNPLLLVSVARGGVVDEEALLRALDDGRVEAAALDVFETEPLPRDHPLWQRDNVMITPHAAGFGDPVAIEDMIAICQANLHDFLADTTPRDALATVPRAASEQPRQP